MAVKTKPKRKPPKPRKKPDALSPTTSYADPSAARFIYIPRQTSGVRVTEDNALTLAAVWGCVTVVTEALASMPWRVKRRRPNGKGADYDPTNTADWLLNTQANEEVNAFAFRETIIGHCMLWGNGYAEIERDTLGRPAWLHLLTPDRVRPERDSRGNLYYDVWNYSGSNTALSASDVYHLKGLGFDGLGGYSVIRMAARSLGIGMAGDEYASSFWGNDATPGGILEHPKKLSPEAAKNLADSFSRTHAGPRNARRVAVLEEGVRWTSTGMPMREAQFLESRKFQATDICRIFRVPPHKIADLERATFSNIESQEIAFVVDCLGPWAVRLESEADIKLFGRNQRGVYFTKLNLNSRMRGDTAARSASYTALLDRGVYSVNDVLELEDRNPIGPDGDKRFVPLNMQLLEKAGEDPPPTPPTPVPPEQPAPDATPAPLKVQLHAVCMPMLTDVLGRAVRRHKQRQEDAQKRLAGKPEALQKWQGEFLAEHAGYIRKGLQPVLESIGGLTGKGVTPALEVVRELFLKEYPQQWESGEGALANGLLARTVASLYSEDQPRDDDGKFGEGGSGGSKDQQKEARKASRVSEKRAADKADSQKQAEKDMRLDNEAHGREVSTMTRPTSGKLWEDAHYQTAEKETEEVLSKDDTRDVVKSYLLKAGGSTRFYASGRLRGMTYQEGGKTYVDAGFVNVNRRAELSPDETTEQRKEKIAKVLGVRSKKKLTKQLARLIAALYSDDQPRDDAGRFGEGGGGADQSENPYGADYTHTAQDEAEDNAIDDQRGVEDQKLEKTRDKEDSKLGNSREKEDRQLERTREREDEKTSDKRSDELDRFGEKQSRQKERFEEKIGDKYGGDLDKATEEMDRARAEHGDGSPEVKEAEKKFDVEQEKYDKIINEKTDAYDAKQKKELEDFERQRDTQHEQEDRATEQRRIAEDKSTQERRDREDADIIQRREQEDGSLFDRREAEDAALIQRRVERDKRKAG